MPDAKLVDKAMAFNKSLADAGVLLELDGSHPPSVGARDVRRRCRTSQPM
jgi:hypothetical protein